MLDSATINFGIAGLVLLERIMVLGIDDVSYFILLSRVANNFSQSFLSVNKTSFVEENIGKILPQDPDKTPVSSANSPTIESIDILFQQGLLGRHCLSFLTDKNTRDIVVIVKDKAFGEVLREIPSQEIRDLAQSLLPLQQDSQIQTGLLLDIKI